MCVVCETSHFKSRQTVTTSPNKICICSVLFETSRQSGAVRIRNAYLRHSDSTDDNMHNGTQHDFHVLRCPTITQERFPGSSSSRRERYTSDNHEESKGASERVLQSIEAISNWDSITSRLAVPFQYVNVITYPEIISLPCLISSKNMVR
jgi:hypothetical protein